MHTQMLRCEEMMTFLRYPCLIWNRAETRPLPLLPVTYVVSSLHVYSPAADRDRPIQSRVTSTMMSMAFIHSHILEQNPTLRPVLT